jgi:opacity protein-like surface antigen
MNRKGKITRVLVLAVALLVLPGAAQAETYAEFYLGGVQAANAPMHPSIANWGGWSQSSWDIPGRLDPAFLGGLKIGTWFVREGFLGFNYPEWMKYFGFYLDFSYHRLDFRRQTLTDHMSAPGYYESNIGKFWSEGKAATLAFMFAFRYGFLPNKEVPFGRLQPYVAVGPAILFASQKPAFTREVLVAQNPVMVPLPYKLTPPVAYQKDFASDSVAAICLAVDAGVRWMALKNVSVDLFFRYRYARPSFTYSFPEPEASYWGDPLGNTSLTLKPTFHLFSGNLGVAYHF